MSLAKLLREATLYQVRRSQMRSPEVADELKKLRLQLGNIANNINQIARHSNRVKHVVDENEFFALLKSLQDFYEGFAEEALNSNK